MNECKIADVSAREILDSRGNPTLEARVMLVGGHVGIAMVPSGASTGQFEAVELRDGEDRFQGKGVLGAVSNVNTVIKEALVGKDCDCQRLVDDILLHIDGTSNKTRLGANALLGVSLAAARAAANCYGLPLYRYLGGIRAQELPIPMMNILNGGKHADNTVDFQEFMIMPGAFMDFAERIRVCTEVYHSLKKLLEEKNLSTGVGDEGGFAPDLADPQEALELICQAVGKAGYVPGKDVFLALDVAASELYHSDSGLYEFPGESKMSGRKITRTSQEMTLYVKALAEGFPLLSVEDGLDEEDWEGWKQMTAALGDRLALVGDDLFVTNVKRLQKGIAQKAGNAILIKLNQIGTLSETLDAIRMAQEAGFRVIISHRSGETEDTTIADLAVAVGAGYIKSGAPCRAERTAKYNRLLQIGEEL